jgi:hypothetical protein
MGLAGFFLDDIIRGILRHVRREKRINRAMKWPKVGGTLQRFTTREGFGSGSRPVVEFTYQVSGEQYSGQVTGNSESIREIERIANDATEGTALQVRCDPADPAQHLLLNLDNPNFPFVIDHDQT